jgi:polar amino acid transport system substrate-binding protein
MLQKLIIIFLLPLQILAQKVIIYAECGYKPYSYCEDKKVKGISIDIFKSIFSKIDDYTLEIKGINLEKARKKMKNREILMLGTMSYRKSRLSYIYYTAPYIYHNKALYCNKKFTKDVKWPEDFYGLKLARAKGHSMGNALKKAVEDGHIKIIDGNASENIKKLVENKVDCYIDDSIALKGELIKIKKEYKENKLPLDKINNITKVLSFSKSPYHIGFSKINFPARDDLIKKINLAIRVMNNSNEIEEIIEKNLDRYLHPDKKRRVSIALYNWGEKLVSDKLDGFGAIPQVVKSAFSARNIEVNYTFYYFKYAYLLTKWGKECVSMPWLKNKDRETYFYFSNNIKNTGIYLFYKKEYHPKGINSTKKYLKQYRIGGVKGYSYEEYFQKRVLFNYRTFETMDKAVIALFKGQIDIIPAEKNRFLFHLEKNFYNIKDEIDYNKEPIIKNRNYLIFSKKCEGSKELRSEFHKGLDIIEKNGVLQKILAKFDLVIEDFY